ncbi:MAG: hypothetical protein FWC79_05500 [Oscillospiraceae bacterium]|nr:hypothetical protein [Oscillospiraceae bacterium]
MEVIKIVWNIFVFIISEMIDAIIDIINKMIIKVGKAFDSIPKIIPRKILVTIQMIAFNDVRLLKFNILFEI